MSALHISLGFGKYPDPQLQEFAQNVITKMTGNAAFPTPPATLAVLGTQAGAFNTAVGAAIGGSLLSTATKKTARNTLLATLKSYALYVEQNSAGNVATALSSGFQINSTSHTPSVMTKVQIVSLDNGDSTQLILRLQPVANAKSYEVRIATGAGPWQSAGIFTQARKIVLTGLTPGTTYNVSARAVGGANGYGDWSDPVSHMAT